MVYFGIISGIFASTGSVFGKLSGLPTFQDDYFLRIIFFVLMLVFNTISMTFFVKALQQNLSIQATLISSSTNYIVTDDYFLRIIFFVLMLVFNTISMTFFVKALQQNLSIQATLISSSTNYIVTALAGYVIFQETTSLMWWSGIFLIIIGLVLILRDSAEDNLTQMDKNK